MLNKPVLVLNRSYLPIHVTSVRRAFSLVYQDLARIVDADHRTFDFEEWLELRVDGDGRASPVGVGPVGAGTVGTAGAGVHGSGRNGSGTHGSGANGSGANGSGANGSSSADRVGTSRGPIRIPRVIVLTVFDRVPRRHVRFSRSNVMTRDAFTCQYCGIRPPRAELNLDHVVPRAHGGRSTWENVVASCVDCNRRKGGRTPEQAGLRLRRPPTRPRWTPLASLPLATVRHEEWHPYLRVVDKRIGERRLAELRVADGSPA